MSRFRVACCDGAVTVQQSADGLAVFGSSGSLPRAMTFSSLARGIGYLDLLGITGRWGRIDAFGRGRIVDIAK